MVPQASLLIDSWLRWGRVLRHPLKNRRATDLPQSQNQNVESAVTPESSAPADQGGSVDTGEQASGGSTTSAPTGSGAQPSASGDSSNEEKDDKKKIIVGILIAAVIGAILYFTQG